MLGCQDGHWLWRPIFGDGSERVDLEVAVGVGLVMLLGVLRVGARLCLELGKGLELEMGE